MNRVRHAALSLLIVVTLGVAIGAQAAIQYVYDELGRLVAVIDGTGGAAAYHYDAVGNLLGITRTTSTQVAIVEFTPNAGPTGQSVAIHGTGFSATAGLNTVTFNGTGAAITSATTTMLVVTVPIGAATGVISVTSPNGSAATTGSFSVVTPGGPAVTSVSPVQGVHGLSVTIAGTNFQTIANQNLVTFNGSHAAVTASTSTSIATAVPPTATSGKISIATPFGKVTDSTDFIVPPPPLTLSNVSATSRMTVGSSQVVTVSTASTVALVLFDATAGQRVTLDVSSGVPANLKVLSYDGTTLTFASTNQFVDAIRMPATATYTIVVDPTGSNTGSLTLTLADVPADVTGVIAEDGTAHPLTMSTAGQNARLTFTGSVGQRISLKVGSGPLGNVHIYKPDRSLLASTTIGVLGTFIDTQTLAMAGTYTVTVDYGGDRTGSVTLNLYTVPADVTSAITADAASLTLATTVPGQNAAATFTGTTGHRMSVWITGVSGSPVDISILNASGVSLGTVTVGSLGGFLEPVTLAASETHSILVDRGGSAFGNVTLRLYDVPADLSGSITINGPSVGVSLPSPGQNASYTFTGTASQQVTVRITSSDFNLPSGSNSTVTVKLVRANGTVLASSTSGSANFNLATQTLPANETYTVLIDTGGPNVGTLTVSVTNP